MKGISMKRTGTAIETGKLFKLGAVNQIRCASRLSKIFPKIAFEKLQYDDPWLKQWEDDLPAERLPDFYMLFPIKKHVEDPKLRKLAEKRARINANIYRKVWEALKEKTKQASPNGINQKPVEISQTGSTEKKKSLEDTSKGADILNKLLATESSAVTMDNILDINEWDSITPEAEVVASRLVDLKHGDTVVVLGSGISGLSLAWFLAHTRPDLKIKLIEKQSKVGGYLNSMKWTSENHSNSNTSNKNKKSVLFETGPRTLLPGHAGTKIIVDMANTLGLVPDMRAVPKLSATNTKGLVFNGKLVQLPNSLIEGILFLFSPLMDGLKTCIFTEIFRKSKNTTYDESVESFMTRRFNKIICDRFISPIMRGIYAGDISQLSAKSVPRFNQLYSLEKSQGISVVGAMFSGITRTLNEYSRNVLPRIAQAMTLPKLNSAYKEVEADKSLLFFKDGIETLPKALETNLKQKFGDRVEFIMGQQVTGLEPVSGGCTVTTSDSASNQSKIDGSIVISTLPARQVTEILTVESAEFARHATGKIKATTTAVVNFWFPQIPKAKDWFGFLVPRTEDRDSNDILGVIFDSAVRNAGVPINESMQSMVNNEHGNEGTVLTVMMGGYLWDNQTVPEKQEIIRRSTEFLTRHLGSQFATSEFVSNVTIQDNAIPQYTVGRSELIQQIHENISTAYNNRVFLSGTSFGRGIGISDAVLDSLCIATRYSRAKKLLEPKFYINNMVSLTHPDIYV